MTTPHEILLIEDDPKIRAQLVFQLREEGYRLRVAASAEDAERELGSDSPAPDLLLVDVRLPGRSGVDLIRDLDEAGRLPPTVVLSGEASISEVVDALRTGGVHDFIEKPFRRERLLRSLANALENDSLRREVRRLQEELDAGPRLLGGSPAMRRLEEQIARAAPTEATLLIRGESGSGKELVAEAIHRGSSRSDGPLVRVNCAAIAPHLVEDELFGHVAGAFTGAAKDRPGLFEAADGGTLFLDEIGDMALELQARLLRVLEDGKVRRLGETTDRSVDVRIVAATHRDLTRAVREGDFREDLTYRLAHLVLEVPPLRERAGDVEELLDHFLAQFARRHRRPKQELEPDALERLRGYPWPGNVRELRNVCERLVVFGPDCIGTADLPAALNAGSPDGGPATGLVRLEDGVDLPLREFRTRCEREYVEHVLRRTAWNVAETARRLGLRRTYLHEKIGQLGLHRPESPD